MLQPLHDTTGFAPKVIVGPELTVTGKLCGIAYVTEICITSTVAVVPFVKVVLFVIDKAAPNPVLLISAGVQVTPHKLLVPPYVALVNTVGHAVADARLLPTTLFVAFTKLTILSRMVVLFALRLMETVIPNIVALLGMAKP